jgi:diacylglycerol O-acyltransferase
VELTRLRLDELMYAWFDDPDAPLQPALLAEFDATPFTGPHGRLDTGRVRAELAVRAARAPQLRRRVLWTRPGEGRPAWIDQPGFDALDHVQAAVLPPGADLPSWVASRAARPLDRDRPLWRIEVIDGLPGRRFAVSIVASHVLADGRAGMALLGALLDPGPDSTPAAAPRVPARRLPTRRELRRAYRHEVARRLTGSPGRVRSRSSRRPDLGSARRTLRAFTGREPPTPLPRDVGPDRRLCVVGRPLREVQETGHLLGVTVNDLLLAAVTEGLRRLLAGRVEAPAAAALRASVPVAGQAGRQVTGMLVIRLPIGEPDLLRRLALLHRATTGGKQQLGHAQDPADVHLPLWAARGLLRAARRFGSRRMTLSVTDVPGPAAPLWLAGARLLAAVPVPPLAPGVPLSVAALSYAGELTVSAAADASVADLEALTGGIGAALRSLTDSATTGAHLPAVPGPSARRGGPWSAVPGIPGPHPRWMGMLSTMRCRIGGHAGTWTEPGAGCARSRTCRRCGQVSTEQQHIWTAFAYDGHTSCEQERHCERCGATESRVLHSWGPWRYDGPDSFLLKLHQTHTCARCSADEQQEVERAF